MSTGGDAYNFDPAPRTRYEGEFQEAVEKKEVDEINTCKGYHWNIHSTIELYYRISWPPSKESRLLFKNHLSKLALGGVNEGCFTDDQAEGINTLVEKLSRWADRNEPHNYESTAQRLLRHIDPDYDLGGISAGSPNGGDLTGQDHLEAIGDDYGVLDDKFGNDCEDMWLSLGSSIQLGRAMLGDHAESDVETDWMVDDWTDITDSVARNVHKGAKNMADMGCLSASARTEFEDMAHSISNEDRLRDALTVVKEMEELMKEEIPEGLRVGLLDVDSAEPIESVGKPSSFEASCTRAAPDQVESALNDLLAQAESQGQEPVSITNLGEKQRGGDEQTVCMLLRDVAEDV